MLDHQGGGSDDNALFENRDRSMWLLRRSSTSSLFFSL